jgi:hypothetical protein
MLTEAIPMPALIETSQLFPGDQGTLVPASFKYGVQDGKP